MSRNLPILRAEATAMLCAICPKPGHCCRDFRYHKPFWKDLGLDEAQKWIGDVPFLISGWSSETWQDENGREYAFVICECPKVTSEGRCSIYETRPWTCRTYAPGSDNLCVFQGSSGIKFWDRP